MREELSEPQHWRASSERNTQRNNSWISRRRSQEQFQLDQADMAAEAIDAALEQTVVEESISESLDSTDIIASLASQLDLLEKQREQIQRLLDQAQGS